MADYFAHPAWLPSFSLALLYLTVLSFSGQMVTFLVASGFNSFHIALTRSLATMIELSATWIAPRVMARISPARGGMWFLSWQMLWLAATIGFFYAEKRPIVAASGLAAGTIMSRVGLWGFDLCAQTIVQMEVRDTNRGSFSSTEAMFQNVFELVSFALTIVLPRPDQFRWPVLVSVVVTFSAGGLYAFFLRKRRGHLLHLPCIEHKTAGA
jgi:iron-regulated transporter 1